MQHPLRVVAAVALLAAFLAIHTQAGSQTNPEVVDNAYDVKTTPGDAPVCTAAPVTTTAPVVGGTPVGECATGSGVDVTEAWVANETASSVKFWVAGVGVSIQYQGTVNFNFKVGGTSYVASAVIANLVNSNAPQAGNGVTTPGGVASNASQDQTNKLLSLTVLKSAIGNPKQGDQITAMEVDAFANPVGKVQDVLYDHAPDTGVSATPYNFTLGPGGPTGTPGDSDGDLLNDTWETTHFGNLNQNATGDPDHDGCNNACEQQHETDPTKADTDGDGCSDGNEVKAGTNPNNPSSHPSDCGTVTNTSSTSPASSSTSSPPTSSHSSTQSSTAAEGTDAGDFGDRMSEAFGSGGHFYLLIICAGALVVIVVSLIARGGRWGL